MKHNTHTRIGQQKLKSLVVTTTFTDDAGRTQRNQQVLRFPVAAHPERIQKQLERHLVELHPANAPHIEVHAVEDHSPPTV